MNGQTIRAAEGKDEAAICALLSDAFGGSGEADLVSALRRDGDAVLELVAELDGDPIGHILFSRLWVESAASRSAAVALAPLAVSPGAQGRGIGSALVIEGHARLRETGEALSVVLGDPAFYGRFGYFRERAEAFESLYQCEALQALVWSAEAPSRGRLLYAPAFAAL